MWKLIKNKIKEPTIDKEIETLKEECRQLAIESKLIRAQMFDALVYNGLAVNSRCRFKYER